MFHGRTQGKRNRAHKGDMEFMSCVEGVMLEIVCMITLARGI